MEIKTLAKNTMILAMPKVLKFFVGVIRAKLIAVFLGTTGAGIISQLQNTIQQISTFTLSSLPEGMVKLVAQENAGERNIDKIYSIIKTYLLIIIPLTVFITVLGYIFAEKITMFILGDLKYKLYFQIVFLALPVSILNASSIQLMAAYKEVNSIAYSGMVIIIINFILFVPLIYFFRIKGAAVYVSLSFFIMFFVSYYYMKKSVLKKNNFSYDGFKKVLVSKIYLKELIGFMGFGLVAGTYYMFTEITTRAIVVNELGIEKLGVYAPITAWASLFVGFILPSLNTYLFPRISEAKDDKDIVNVVNDVIRLLTFITLPFVIIGITIRQWIIPVFYSKDFMDAAIYLPYHFAAIMITIWTYAFTYIFAPTGRLKSFLIFAIMVHSLSLALVYFLVPRFGMFGYLSKFTITPVFSLMIYSTFWVYKIKFRLKKENIAIVLFSIISVLILLLIQNKNGYLQLVGLGILVVQFFLLKKEEKDFLLRKIKFKK